MKSRGVTLIELLVALVIGHLLVLALISVYQMSALNYYATRVSHQLQADALLATHRLQMLAEQSGYRRYRTDVGLTPYAAAFPQGSLSLLSNPLRLIIYFEGDDNQLDCTGQLTQGALIKEIITHKNAKLYCTAIHTKNNKKKQFTAIMAKNLTQFQATLKAINTPLAHWLINFKGLFAKNKKELPFNLNISLPQVFIND